MGPGWSGSRTAAPSKSPWGGAGGLVMAERTAIEWCHHTFNPWWGCVEVSPGCDHCYAREQAKRYGYAVWGAGLQRRFFGDAHWDEPFRWHRKAEAGGERRRVFCASMADVMEERSDVVGQSLTQARLRLWFVIANTPSLDWLLLTKRPAGFRRLLPPEIAALPNVWLGVSCEDQATADARIPVLLRTPAAVRFVSYEPATGPVDFEAFLSRAGRQCPVCGLKAGHDLSIGGMGCRGLDWLIVGGESGPGARPFDLAWARQTIAQGKAAGVPCFFKQAGARPLLDGVPLKLRDRKGSDLAELPTEFHVQEFPHAP